MSFEQLIPALRARWRTVAFTWVLTVAAAVAVTLALPARYESTATLVLEMHGPDPLGKRAMPSSASLVSTHIATQAGIIASEHVAVQALRSLGLHRDPQWRERWQAATEGRGDFESWLAGQLLRRLDVRPERESNVVNLSYVSPDAAFSREVLNAIVNAYIDTTLASRVRPAQAFNSFFEERAKALREELEKAKARLSAYEREHGVLLGDQVDVEEARLAGLVSQLTGLQDAVAEAANRHRQAMTAPGDVREIRNDPEVAALIAELSRQRNRLTELNSTYGPRHPVVEQHNASIRDLEQRLDAAMRRSAQGFEVPLKVARARLAEVQAAVERQRALVLEHKARRDAAAALIRDVENAQRAYDAVLARASETALEGANTTQTNVRVIKAASLPPWPLNPLRLNVAVAALAGLLLGIALAVFREGRDRRLRTVNDITDRLALPMLLALPDGQAKRRHTARIGGRNPPRLGPGTPPGLAAP